jgi:hypothetical protein
MIPETQQSESPYCVRIETETGQSSTVPIAVLTPKQLEDFLQSEFKRLAQEAGVKGARIHVERAIAADYEQVLREVAACLFSAKARAAWLGKGLPRLLLDSHPASRFVPGSMPTIPDTYMVEPTLIAWLNSAELGASGVLMICLVM